MAEFEFEPLTLTAAKELTERIRLAATEYGDLIVTAFERHADKVLGYDSWEAYVTAEFPAVPRFDNVTRTALARKLTGDVGMTTRQAGATLGVNHTTVVRDLAEQRSPGANAPRAFDRGILTEEFYVAENPDALGVVPVTRPEVGHETDDMEARAVRMAQSGMSLVRIAETLGVDRRHPLVRTNERVRAARRAFDESSMPSVTHEENTIACEIRPVKDVMHDVDFALGNLLDKNLYTLSAKDLLKLRAVLAARLEEAVDY